MRALTPARQSGHALASIITDRHRSRLGIGAVPATRARARPGPDRPVRGLVDHRGRRGRRHPLGFVLAVLVAAFISPTYATLAAAAAWATGASSDVLAALGGWRDPFTGRVAPPSEATLGRIARTLPPRHLEAVSAALTARLRITDLTSVHALLAAAGIKAAAGDGKVVRGSKRRATTCGVPAQAATYLVSVVTHATTTCPPVVIAQGEAVMSADAMTTEAVKKGEAAAMRGLLAEVDPSDTVVTFDAAHVYPATARAVADAGGYYLIALKANQPTLMSAADAAVATARRAGHLDVGDEVTRGNGRVTRRVVEVVHVTDADADADADADEEHLTGLAFPQVSAVIRVTRWWKASTDKVWEAKEVSLLVTSLPRHLCVAEVVAVLTRGHWSVESMHWGRHVGFGEDASTVHADDGPHNLATVRNIITTLIAGVGGKISATRRQAARSDEATLALLTGRLKPDKTRT